MKSFPFLLIVLLTAIVSYQRSIQAVTVISTPNATEIQTHQNTWQEWRDTALAYINIGDFQAAENALQKSRVLLQQQNTNPRFDYWQARVLDVQGKLELLRGEDQLALQTWQTTAAIYQRYKDPEHFAQAVLNQIQALQNLGYYHQAAKIVEHQLAWLLQQPDSELKVKALQNFGDIAQHLGDFQTAQKNLDAAKEIAIKNQYTQLLPEITFSLAQLHHVRGETLEAAQLYQTLTSDDALGFQAQINLLELLQDDLRLSQTLALTDRQQTEIIRQKLAHLDNLPPSRPLLFSRIDFAHHLLQNSNSPQQLIQDQLTTVYEQAQRLSDRRAQAYALGELGELYFKAHRLQEAQTLTEQALVLSQSLNAPELSYQWQWQLGKIYQQYDQRAKAIAAYENAIKNLEAIRSDLVSVSAELQFSFREDIEPVYRELASLLLYQDSTQTELQQARDVIEKLQLAELDNFFRDACLDAKPVAIDELDPHAAIFYTIILGDRLEVIVALPNQPLSHYAVHQSATEIQTKWKQALSIITNIKSSNSSQPYPIAQPPLNRQILAELYQDLIAPSENILQAQKIQTLVFIADGILQRVPMGILYDGQQYLLEKYNVAIAPSLQLIDPTPFRTVQQAKKQVLSAGISKAIHAFDPLPGVENELQKIQAETQSKILLNEQFTKLEFAEEIENLPYKVVHIASHGQFSSNLEETFILTWDDFLRIHELQTLLKGDQKQLQPIELLVLSACTTAAGDERAVLGLAGIAVRSGARSTIASLWSVDDQSTTYLMGNFYHYLAQGNYTKAAALRQAQLDLLNDPQYAHPYYWSAFTLIGNWL